MNNDSKNHGILPPNGDNSPNTRESSEYSPEFFNELLKTVVPDFHNDTSLLGLIDGQHAILDSIKHQLAFIQSLAVAVGEDGSIDLKASSLHGISELLLQQVAIVKLSVDEVHRLNKDNFLQQKITALEDDQESLMRLINRLKNENAELKGSEYKIAECNL